MVGPIATFNYPAISEPEKVDWLHHHLRLSECGYAGRWPCHQRVLRGYLLCTSPSIHLRTGPSKQAGPSCRSTAVGYHVGHHDYVLVSHHATTSVVYEDMTNKTQHLIWCLVH